MKIIYHCVGGSHSSSTACAIHLNKLPKDRIPSKEEIMAINYFDKLEKKDRGTIFFRGIDEFGNEVYNLGRQFNKELVLNSIRSSYNIAGGDLKEILFVDTMKTVNILMKIGGFSSRRINLVSFGRPIVIKGTQKAYKNLIQLVEDTKKMINS